MRVLLALLAFLGASHGYPEINKVESESFEKYKELGLLVGKYQLDKKASGVIPASRVVAEIDYLSETAKKMANDENISFIDLDYLELYSGDANAKEELTIKIKKNFEHIKKELNFKKFSEVLENFISNVNSLELKPGQGIVDLNFSLINISKLYLVTMSSYMASPDNKEEVKRISGSILKAIEKLEQHILGLFALLEVQHMKKSLFYLSSYYDLDLLVKKPYLSIDLKKKIVMIDYWRNYSALMAIKDELKNNTQAIANRYGISLSVPVKTELLFSEPESAKELKLHYQKILDTLEQKKKLNTNKENANFRRTCKQIRDRAKELTSKNASKLLQNQLYQNILGKMVNCFIFSYSHFDSIL